MPVDRPGRRAPVVVAAALPVAAVPDALGAAFSILGGLALVVAKAYGGLLALLFLFQRKLIFMPPAQVADPASGGGEVVLLPRDGGERLAAVFFPPRTPDAPVLAFFHGNADQLGWSAAYLGQRMSTGFGVGFLGIEYPGYGLAGGRPSEASIYSAADHVLRHLAKERGIPSSRIVLFGHSVGSGVAVEMANRNLGARLVLVSPFLSINEMACALYPFVAPALRVLPFMILDRFDNQEKAPHLKLPTLIIHGTDDDIVPFSQGQRLQRQIGGAQLFRAKGVGHNDVFEDEQVIFEIAAFANGS